MSWNFGGARVDECELKAVLGLLTTSSTYEPFNALLSSACEASLKATAESRHCNSMTRILLEGLGISLMLCGKRDLKKRND